MRSGKAYDPARLGRGGDRREHVPLAQDSPTGAHSHSRRADAHQGYAR